MLCNGISELVEAIYRMALSTIRLFTVFGKLPLMVIGMTVSASVMPERISCLALVAVFAADCLMLPFKPEIGLVVVKLTCPPGDSPERYFRMTLTAVLSELVLMRILVTVCAVAEWYSSEFLKYLAANRCLLVTLEAFNCFMAPNEREPCIVMTEFRCRHK